MTFNKIDPDDERELEAMRVQRDRAEERARRLEAEIVDWKDAAMFVCAPVTFGGELRPSKVREAVASLRRALEVKREQDEYRAKVGDELRARAENAERELASVDMILCVTGADDAFRCATLRAIRARLETAERERDAARAERDALRRHYDKAGPEHNLLALLDMYDERRAAAESERDEARAERDEAVHIERVTSDVLERIKAALRMPQDGGSYVEWANTIRRAYDARPDISPEDAALHTGAVTFAESVGASQRIHAAIRAHAAKVMRP